MKNKKCVSINANGELEFLTKEEFKKLRLGYVYVLCDYSTYEEDGKLFYVPYQRYIDSFVDTINLNSDFRLLLDFIGNFRLLTTAFSYAKVYSLVKAIFSLMNFNHRNLKMVECSRILNKFLSDIYENE